MSQATTSLPSSEQVVFSKVSVRNYLWDASVNMAGSIIDGSRGCEGRARNLFISMQFFF